MSDKFMDRYETKRMERIEKLESFGIRATIGQYHGEIRLSAGETDKLLKLLILLAYQPEPRLLTAQQLHDVRWRADQLLQWICEHPADGDGLAIMHAKAIVELAEREAK